MANRDARIETFHSTVLPKGLPFAAAVRAGGLVWVSGQIGNVPGEMRLVDGGLDAESRQALAHLQDALEQAGSSLDQVVKCTVFLADMADFGAFNEIYCDVFGRHLPARSGIAVNGLALGAKVEIECVALADSAN